MEQTEQVVHLSEIAEKIKPERKFGSQTVKAILAAAVSFICLLCFLLCGIVGRELSDIGQKGSFSGISVIGSLFNGGELTFSYYVDGTAIGVTSYLPAGMRVLLAGLLVLFALYFLYETAVVAVCLRRGEERAKFFNTAGGWAGIALGILSVVVYVVQVCSAEETSYLQLVGLDYELSQAEFYRVFSPSVIWLIAGAVAVIFGVAQRKIDDDSVVLLKKFIPSYLFMVVPIALIAVFNLYPIVLQTVLSFKNYSLGTGVFNSPWVGFSNFVEIFSDSDMMFVIWNTLYISLLRLIGSTLPPLILSIFLYDMRMSRARKVVQTIVYIPHFFSWTIIYAITYAFLNEEGIVSAWLGQTTSIMTNESAFFPIVIITGIWKELGWGTILYLAALSSVPPELYEAAKLDGAGPWQRVRHITLPGILPIVIYLLIINLGQILKQAGGEQLLLFANAVTRPKAMVIDTWLYWESLGELKYSLGAAMSFFQAGIGMILVVLCNWLSRRTTGIGMW